MNDVLGAIHAAIESSVTTVESCKLSVSAPHTSGRVSVWFQKRRPNCCGTTLG